MKDVHIEHHIMHTNIHAHAHIYVLFFFTRTQTEPCANVTNSVEETTSNGTAPTTTTIMNWTKKKVKLQHYNVIIDRAANKKNYMYAKKWIKLKGSKNWKKEIWQQQLQIGPRSCRSVARSFASQPRKKSKKT